MSMASFSSIFCQLTADRINAVSLAHRLSQGTQF
jgi:hypothetical protein